MTNGKQKVQSRMFVVDASVARAAGTANVDSTSSSCRRFLETMLTVCHRIAMTADIRDEWNRHQGNYARKWRKQMVSRKKLVALKNPETTLAVEIADLDIAAGQQRAMLKDSHLVDAALIADRRIVALDERARGLFCRASAVIRRIEGVHWVNPADDVTDKIRWLEAGARDMPAWQIQAGTDTQ